MDTATSRKPLDSFPIVRSRNIEEIRQAFIGSYGAQRLNLPRHADDFEFRLNHWQSENIGVTYVSGPPLELQFPTANFFRQAFVRGAADIKLGRVVNQVMNDATCVIPPDALATASYAPGFEHFGLRIKADAVLTKLAALIGATPSRKLVFDQTTRANSSAIGSLRRMLTFFAEELDSVGCNPLPPPIAELEQALIVSFICNNPHNYTPLLDARIRPVGSWQVRRAEEYIAAHWNQPITIEELARVTSASTRSLFHQFKRSRGQSPMAFVKDVRLQQARNLLERSDPATSVTEVAIACGFGNLGHFAKDYFKRFGERPSDTVKRSRNLGASRGVPSA